MSKILSIFLFFIFSSSLFAQEDKLFKNFAIDNPIAYQFVMTITQDKHGFIWFGAQEGLHRFDGYQLVSFNHDPNDHGSLSSNVISSIITDKKDRLWVGTQGGGINLYQEKNKKFIHINTATKNSALSNDNVNIVFEDSQGKIWVGTENGLNVIETSNTHIEVKQIHQILGNPNSLTHNTIHAITESKNGNIWVGTNGGGISVFDINGQFVKSVRFGDTNKSHYSNKFINALLVDNAENLWIGTVDNGLLKYSPTKDSLFHYKFEKQNQETISSNTINDVYQDSSNNIWVATDNGLTIYNDKKNTFERYKHSPNDPYSVSNDYIITFFEDKNNMMWIGTFTGVNRWDPNMTTFSQYTGKNIPDLVSRNITSFVQLDNKTTIFSTYSGGIYQLSLESDEISRIDLNGHFSELRIMALFGEGNNLWVGTRAAGLHKVDLLTKKITTYKHNESDPFSISANSVTDIIRDKKGNLWVSTFYQGLNRLDNNGSFTRYTKNEVQPELGPSNNLILHLLEDEQGIIWIATYGGGLSRLDPQKEKFTHIVHNKQLPNSLSSDLAWYLLLDKNNDLWVSTQAAGLNILTQQDRIDENYVFRRLNTKDGMKSHTVYSMVQDSFDNIWLSSNKGVSRYSPKANNFKHFDLSHGLVDLDFNHGAIYRGFNDLIYFGAGKGFSTVNPANSNKNMHAPDVRLTNIFRLNEPMLFDSSLAELKELTLSHADQLVSFEYVGLNYANPDSTRYQYRLLGFDQSWIDAGVSRRVSYTNLPAGNYQLQIIAGNNDGAWSEPGLTLDIIVKPAPWNTWWAYLLYAVLIALLLLSYSRFLNRKLILEQQQKAYLKQQVEEKTQEFQQKNVELEQANIQLENAATTDKVTGVKSRRYLDIYIEQATQLMSQIHENILPVQRSILPRLYLVMVRINGIEQVTNSQLINLTDLLLYSRNNEDLVIRWSEDTFSIIGYEKDDNVRELASRLNNRFAQVLGASTKVDMAYSFYPFNFEQPMDLNWDQVSVLAEYGLNMVSENQLEWLGLYGPKVQPFNYLEVLKQKDLNDLAKLVKLKQN